MSIGGILYKYDKAGNPAEISGEELHRSLVWDCENRLRLIDDGDKLHIYTYDHSGERALKCYGNKTNVGIDAGESQSVIEEADGYSAYFSPYFVETNNGRYSKHYYAGAMRIASKIGASGSTYAAGTDEPDLYFYHTDHLGSTTYITDRKEVAQYVAYTPYGETFKEYKNVTPYKFNGKELDQETGYYYYGARYYDPSAALWLGVDPLAEKYPGVSPYVYCAGNPVIARDENGEWINYVVGAVLGAAVEYGSQVAQNLIKNPNDIVGAFTENIDVLDIAIAAGEGAITSGGSVIRRAGAKTASSIVSDVLSNTFDVNITSDGLELKVNEAEEVVTNTVIDRVAGKVADSKLVKKITDKVTPQINIKSNNKTTKEIYQSKNVNSKQVTWKQATNEALKKVNAQKNLNQTMKNASKSAVAETGKNLTKVVIKEDN